MTRDLLLAGCGDVGTALGQRMVARGWRATGLRRHPEHLPDELTPLCVDLTDPEIPALPCADAVVITLTADGRDAAAYERSYLAGLRGLHAALLAGGGLPPRVVLVSSTGVLGGEDGEVLTEDAAPAPARDTARVLLAAEQLAAELFPGLTIVRPAGIYGPGRGALIERVRAGRALEHRRMTNRIHRDDLVTVLQAVLEVPQAPSLLHAVDTQPAPLGEVAAHIARRLGVPVPPDSSPDTSPDGARVRGKILDSARMQALVGALAYPTYREGYDTLLPLDPPSKGR